MYLAVIFGGKLPPKIAPKTKIAVIIVVNYYCKNGCSQRESNPQLALRRRLLYPFNYENECRIFGLFSLFGIGNHIYESNHSRDELPLFLILTSQAPLLESNSKFIPFSFQRVQLGGPRYIHLTKGTNAVFSGFFSLLATVDISMNSITLVMNYLYFIPDKDFPASRYFL